MPLTDTNNKPWAHSTTVKAGDVLRTDGGFTCMKEGHHKIVHLAPEGSVKGNDPEYDKDPISRLYVECDDGKHLLCGQVGDDGELIGLYPETAPSHEAVPADTDPPRAAAA